MNASKEQCRKAKEALRVVSIQGHILPGDPTNEILFINDFLEAAERKLPTEAAFSRDKKKSKQRV